MAATSVRRYKASLHKRAKLLKTEIPTGEAAACVIQWYFTDPQTGAAVSGPLNPQKIAFARKPIGAADGMSIS